MLALQSEIEGRLIEGRLLLQTVMYDDKKNIIILNKLHRDFHQAKPLPLSSRSNTSLSSFARGMNVTERLLTPVFLFIDVATSFREEKTRHIDTSTHLFYSKFEISFKFLCKSTMDPNGGHVDTYCRLFFGDAVEPNHLKDLYQYNNNYYNIIIIV